MGLERARLTGWVVVALLALILLGGSPLSTTARACVTCALGDPTLTTMGLEKPLAGRMRLSLNGHMRSLAEGTEGVDQVLSDEQRLEMGFLWAPVRWLALSVGLPLVRKHRSLVSGAEETAWGLGDLGLHGR
ncbi:MAG: transporter, partial [Myxococcota bacterium]|nr:transporter [Myxococcota bacterium]